jgi:AcrR family transcriptional regulator
VGTLYRHFPRRSDLVVAVFKHEVDACAGAAQPLATEHPPFEALEQWLYRFTDFVSTKHGLAQALHSGDPAFDELPAYFKARFGPALTGLLTTATRAGAVHTELTVDELLYSVARLCQPIGDADAAQSRRLVGTLVKGLRARPVTSHPAQSAPVRRHMPYVVDFQEVSTVGLESSPVAPALAGLRANESRYFKNKYDHDFTVKPAAEAKDAIDWVHRILDEERGIVISSPPLEATDVFQVENIRMAYVFYESGLSINVMYTLDAAGKRAVGFKLSDGMEIPEELASRFKFARQKSKLAGTIRGSYFAFKTDY